MSLTLFQVTPDFSAACFTRPNLDDGLWFALREWDARVIRKAFSKDRGGDKSPSGGVSNAVNAKSLNRSSEQAIRASIRQAVLHMNLRNEAATPDEVKLLKAHGIIGKRAPSCSLICAPDMVKLLISFGKEQVAKELKTALDTKEGRLSTIQISAAALERSNPKRRIKPRMTDSKRRRLDDSENDLDGDDDFDGGSHTSGADRDYNHRNDDVGVAMGKGARIRKPKLNGDEDASAGGAGLDALIEAVEVAGQPSPARKKLLASKTGSRATANGHVNGSKSGPNGRSNNAAVPPPAMGRSTSNSSTSSAAHAFLAPIFADPRLISALQRIVSQGIAAMQDPTVSEAINVLGDTFVSEFLRKTVRTPTSAMPALNNPYRMYSQPGVGTPAGQLSLQQIHQHTQAHSQPPAQPAIEASINGNAMAYTGAQHGVNGLPFALGWCCSSDARLVALCSFPHVVRVAQLLQAPCHLH